MYLSLFFNVTLNVAVGKNVSRLNVLVFFNSKGSIRYFHADGINLVEILYKIIKLDLNLMVL